MGRNPFIRPKIKYLPDIFGEMRWTEKLSFHIFCSSLHRRRRFLKPFRLMYHSFCNTFLSYYYISDYYDCCVCERVGRLLACTHSANNKRKSLLRPTNGFVQLNEEWHRRKGNMFIRYIFICCYVNNVCVSAHWLTDWLVTLVYLSRRLRRRRLVQFCVTSVDDLWCGLSNKWDFFYSVNCRNRTSIRSYSVRRWCWW